jgi:hypothetical protein
MLPGLRVPTETERWRRTSRQLTRPVTCRQAAVGPALVHVLVEVGREDQPVDAEAITLRHPRETHLTTPARRRRQVHGACCPAAMVAVQAVHVHDRHEASAGVWSKSEYMAYEIMASAPTPIRIGRPPAILRSNG